MKRARDTFVLDPELPAHGAPHAHPLKQPWGSYPGLGVRASGSRREVCVRHARRLLTGTWSAVALGLSWLWPWLQPGWSGDRVMLLIAVSVYCARGWAVQARSAFLSQACGIAFELHSLKGGSNHPRRRGDSVVNPFFSWIASLPIPSGATVHGTIGKGGLSQGVPLSHVRVWISRGRAAALWRLCAWMGIVLVLVPACIPDSANLFSVIRTHTFRCGHPFHSIRSRERYAPGSHTAILDFPRRLGPRPAAWDIFSSSRGCGPIVTLSLSPRSHTRSRRMVKAPG